ncbi:YhjD/YihY/BrkB family envelope integrity protein [Plantactinospora solaniradicis]|uniref:YhjD/YihY/BrkB family envelope integrity protein n=1 Tax=Plantactinospora solaniradicis TaxID=1723736 RepID=A0ABW1K0P6_9ACTN
MNALERVLSRIDRRLTAHRRRSPWFDHLARAVGRYTDVLGGRLAAAIAYYGFLAVFALGLVAYAILGALLGDSAESGRVIVGFLQRNLPFVDPEQIRQSSSRPGIIGLILLAITGIGWVESIRSSQRLIHRLDQHPGYIVLRQLVDLAILLGIFLLLGLSVGAVDALESLLSWLLGARSVALSICSWVLAFLINVLLGSALLLAVPRLRMSFRRWLPPVLFVAVGITLINSVGRYYVVRWERNPAYTVVAGAVGLLIYLYLLNQLLLLGAAIAATGRHGRIRDLAAGGAPVPDPTAAKAPDSEPAASGDAGSEPAAPGDADADPARPEPPARDEHGTESDRPR